MSGEEFSLHVFSTEQTELSVKYAKTAGLFDIHIIRVYRYG